MNTSTKEMQVAIKAALEAGNILLESLDKKKDIWTKEEGRYETYPQDVSNLDMVAQDKIISIIQESYPNHGIISEEKKIENRNCDYCWLIDPLDGTTQYIRNLPYFSVSIALKRKDKIILGVVFSPCLKELFVAERNKGAYLNNKKIKVSDTIDFQKILVANSAFGSYRVSNKQDKFMEVMTSIQNVRIYGLPALDLCYVAAGRFDARIFARTEPWDHSAGCLIVEEAGGKVTDWDGNSWSPDSANLIASNGKIHDKFLKILGD